MATLLDKLAVSHGHMRIPKSRSGRRPIRVDKFLQKEKDGELFKYAPRLEAKTAASGGNVTVSEVGPPDAASARTRRRGDVPSKDDPDAVRREDGRDFAATVPGPGFALGTMDKTSEMKMYELKERLLKAAADLTAASRDQISAKNFAVPAKKSDTGEGKYPVHDKAHAANALARVKQHGTPSERSAVYAAVAKKFPELAARSDVPQVKAKVKQANGMMGVGPAAPNGVAPTLPGMVGGPGGGAPPSPPVQMPKAASLGTVGRPKLAEVSPEEARRALDQLDALEKNKPTARQVAGYSAVGAGAGITGKAIKDIIEHGELFRADRPGRALAGAATAGAVVSGLTPLVRSHLDRSAAESRLREFMAQERKVVEGEKTSSDPLLSRLAEGAGAHKAELAGLAMLAALPADYIQARVRARKAGLSHDDWEQKSLLGGETGHAVGDVAGLGVLAAPSIASLIQHRGGHA